MNLLKLFIFVLFIAMPSKSFTQIYGIRAGLSSPTISEKNGNIFGNDFKIHAGVTAGFPINDFFSLETGLQFSPKGYKIRKEEDVSLGSTFEKNGGLNLYYLDIPLTAKFTSRNIGGINFYCSFGPYMGIGLFGKSKYKINDGYLSEIDTKPINWGRDDGDDLQRLDFGVTAKWGIKISSLQFGLLYSHGMTNISSNTNDYTGVYNRVSGVSLGYKFDDASFDKSEMNISINPKAGISLLGRSRFYKASFSNSLNFKNDKFLVSTDYHYFLKIYIGQHWNMHMISVNAGPRLGGKSVIFDTQIGFGLAWSKEEDWIQDTPVGITIKRKESTLGLNLKTGVMFILNDHFAIGLETHGLLLDGSDIYLTPLLSLEFGKIR